MLDQINNNKQYYYLMERCQHNQKITKFCATQCCVWKEAGGCNNCLKKYHNHMGPSIFIDDKDIEILLKKYKTENNTKPKVKNLEEAIHGYFSHIKQEIDNFLDESNKRIRSQICYPYLNKHSIVNMYKKLKKKQYKKLNQKEFRTFYQITNKFNSQQFNLEEKKLYQESIHKNSQLLYQIFRNFKVLEGEFQKFQVPLKIDKNYENNILQLLQKIQQKIPSHEFVKSNQSSKMIQTPKSIAYQKNPPLDKSISKITKQIRQKINEEIPKQKQIELSQMKSKLLNLMKQDTPYTQPPLPQNSIQLKKVQSIQSTQPPQVVIIDNQISLFQKKQQLKPFEKIQKNQRNIRNSQKKIKEKVNTANNYIKTTKQRQSYIMTQIQKKTNVSDELQADLSISPNKFTNNIQESKFQRDQNSIHSLKFADNLKLPLIRKQSELKNTQMPNTQLPGQDTERILLNKPPLQTKPINNNLRAMVVPIKGEFVIEASSESPISLRKKNDQINHQYKISQQTLQSSKISNRQFNENKSEQIKNKQEQIQQHPKIKLKENQEKSIILLTESLKRKTEEAIPLLYKSLELSTNNLSAAQYLSFLLLETGKPFECLKVCNRIIQQLQGEVIYNINSLCIHNNKAVSLIQLGRYSQSIPLLQKCLQIRQEDRFYKNLGDAYYLIGIYEKSIYNYQKSISLNKNYAETYYNLAVVYYSQQNYTTALTLIQKAKNIEPSRSEYNQLLSQIKSKQ